MLLLSLQSKEAEFLQLLKKVRILILHVNKTETAKNKAEETVFIYCDLRPRPVLRLIAQLLSD